MSDKSRAFVNQTFAVAFAAILLECDLGNVPRNRLMANYAGVRAFRCFPVFSRPTVPRISDRGNLSVSVYSFHIVGEVGHASSPTAATQVFQ